MILLKTYINSSFRWSQDSKIMSTHMDLMTTNTHPEENLVGCKTFPNTQHLVVIMEFYPIQISQIMLAQEMLISIKL
jgi:hypothetical protein